MSARGGAMPEDTRVGTDVAGYRIESMIGRGGMSAVYLAEHLRLGRKVALKILAPELAENQKFRERFLRESQVAASIDHPNIVPIYDADESEGVLYIAMRYVEGTDLGKVIRHGGPLDPDRTASIVGQVASALDAAHGRGLVHRDVKPGNVLLTPQDHVYLSDFGLTKRALSVSGLTQTGQLVGTIDYVAPEQIKGDPVDGRADVYSLGCVLYECLTGKVPYPRDIEVAVLWAHVQEPPPSVAAERPDVPKEVDDVIARAMAKDPEERTSTAGAVATELREALGLETPSAPGVVRPRPIAKKRKPRTRAGLVAAAVGALVVAGAIGALLVMRGGGAAAVVPPVDTVTRIDAATHTFDTPFKVGGNPTGVTVGAGSVWVILQQEGTVKRVAPSTGEILATRSTPGTPTGIAWGEGAAWVTTGYGGAGGASQVVEVNPADDSVSGAFTTSGAKPIVVAFRSIWLADENGDTVLRYDPSTGEKDATISFPENSLPSFLAVGTGKAEGIWVANALCGVGAESAVCGSVSRIDPTGNKITKTVTVDAPSAVAADDRGVWVTSNGNDTVTRFDPATGTTIATLALEGGDAGHPTCPLTIPNGPTSIVIAKDGIWVASNLDPVVVRIDPVTNTVVGCLRVGGIADGMAVDANGDVWVTVHAP